MEKFHEMDRRGSIMAKQKVICNAFMTCEDKICGHNSIHVLEENKVGYCSPHKCIIKGRSVECVPIRPDGKAYSTKVEKCPTCGSAHETKKFEKVDREDPYPKDVGENRPLHYQLLGYRGLE